MHEMHELTLINWTEWMTWNEEIEHMKWKEIIAMGHEWIEIKELKWRN